MVTPGSGKAKEAGGSRLGTSHGASSEAVRGACDLDAKQHGLDMKIREAAQRQRYSPDPQQVTQAARDEATYVVEMDRLMTPIRAVEAQLLLKAKWG